MWLLPVMILGSAFAIILQPYVTNYTAVTIPADADLMLLETSNTGAKAKITAENLRSYMTANSWDYLLVANSWDYYTTNPLAYITGGQVLADNGLTKTVNTVEMWGTLTKSTNIYNDWNNFYVRGDWLNAISNAWIDNYLATHPTSIELYSNNWDMTVTDWVAEINDAFWSKGINYASDYSGNYDARTLIDKWYVDAEILSATPDTIYTADGTLLGSRTIDASWNILNFTNLGFLWFNWANNFEIEFDWAEFKFQSDRMQLNSPLAWNFDFNDLWAVWHDWQATPLWLQYYADYSWTMVDRSIVDKWYVDGEIVDASTLQTWQDTITNQIAQDWYIHVDLWATYIEDDWWATSSQIKIWGYEWEISDENSDTALVIKSPTNSTSEDWHMLMYDNRTSPEWIVYLNDYSATFTGNSLVNKHYVDNSIWAITWDFLPLAWNTEATRITWPVRLESEGSIQWSNYWVPWLPTMEINWYIGWNELLFQVYSGAYKWGFGIENFYPTLNYQWDDIPYAQKVDMHWYW